MSTTKVTRMKALAALVLLSIPALAPAQTARQVAGKKFLISGTGHPNDAVLLTGAAWGVGLCDSRGNWSGTYDVDRPGAVVVTNRDGTPAGSVTATNVAPAVAAFGIMPGTIPGRIRLVGVVVDDTPESAVGLVVTIAGPAPLNGATAKVYPGGVFVLELQYDGTPGTVTATVTDWYGRQGSKQIAVP